MQRARYEEIVLTIPEGMRAEEVADLLDVKGVMDGQAFLALVRGGSASVAGLGDYPWLPAGLPTLEGYLFPDTYRLPARATPIDLIRRMLDNFQNRVTDETLALDGAGRSERRAGDQHGRHRRARSPSGGRPAAGRQRLLEPSGRPLRQGDGGNYLQADPTVQYAAGRPGEWWWKPPSVEAYQTIQSPYNTYLGPDCRRRPSPAPAFRLSGPRPRRRTPSIASSSRPAMGRTSSPRRWLSIRRTSPRTRSDA